MALGSRSRTENTTDTWLTPKYIIDALKPFNLDPCSEKNPPWNIALNTHVQEDNGLEQLWHGFVWCNPPYGNATKDWLKKMAEHNNGIALVFARTETKMFFESVWPKAKAILFLEGRIKFCFPNGTQAKENCGAPSILIAYGTMAVKRLENSKLKGKLTYIN